MRLVTKVLSVVAAVFLGACVVGADDEITTASGITAGTSTDYNKTTTVDTTKYTKVVYIDLSGKWSVDNDSFTKIKKSKAYPFDDDGEYTDADGNATISDSSVIIEYTKDDSNASTGLIKINAQAATEDIAFYVSGTTETGGVKIQSNGTNTVAVYLHDATITSSNYPCIEVTKGSPTVVSVSGTNTFADGRSYGTGYGEEYSTSASDTYTDDNGKTVACTVTKSAQREGSDSKGTLYCKGSMAISGNGSLTVTQSYKNCIASKAILTIESGTYTLTSGGKAGLFGDQGVSVNGGTIVFTGTGAVSSSENHKAHGITVDDETYTNSFVTITGGTLTFETTYGKGITAPVVTIAGGTNTITVNNPTSKVLGTEATYLTADGVSTSGTVSFAPQGIDGGTVTVSGGSTTITTPWSGINADGNITISDGTLTVTTSASGVYDSTDKDYTAPSCLKADGNIIVSGGTVTGTASGSGSKGIKAGGTYTQSNGSVHVTASGSNLGSSGSSSGFGRATSSSSASASAKGVKVTGAITVSGGKLYAKSASHEAIESKSTIDITGGEVYGYSAADDGINAASDMTISGGFVCGYSSANDGLDANGNMYIKGGVIYAVCAKSPEVALDANTEESKKLYITGGTIMTLGPLESGASLTQACYQASSWSANTYYGLTVGTTTYVFKTPASTSGYGSGSVVSGASTPTLTSGASVTGGTAYFDGLVYVGGTKGSTTVSLTAYSNTQTGGGNSGGGMTGPGGSGGGRPSFNMLQLQGGIR